MRIETMSRVGLLLMATGAILMAIATYILYSSLGDYSQCSLAPANVCNVTASVYVQFLNGQQYGASANDFGILFLIIGAVFYAAAQVGKAGLGPEEVSSNPSRTQS